MPEPVLPENPQSGDTGALTAWRALNAWHNDWILPDGSREYVPNDLLGGESPWIVVPDAGASFTVTGDTTAGGGWTDLGNIGASTTVTGS